MQAAIEKANSAGFSLKKPHAFTAEQLPRALELLRQSAETREHLLRGVGNLLQKTSAELVVRVAVDTETRDAPEIERLASQSADIAGNVEQWAASTALQSILSRRPFIENSELVQMIAVPIVSSSNVTEAIAAMFRTGDCEGWKEVTFVQSAVHAIELWDRNLGSQRLIAISEDTAALMEVCAGINQSESKKDCCSRTANRLFDYVAGTIFSSQLNANSLDVFVALIDREGQPVLTAASNSDTVPADPQTLEAVESAIGECLCRNSETNWPPANGNRHALLCHSRLAEHLSRPNLLTQPLHDSEGNLQGAFLIASVSILTDRAQRFCRSSGVPLGSILGLIGRAEQNQLQKFVSKGLDSFRTKKARTILKCVAAAALLGLIPFPYRVATDCEVQPLTRRFVCSPFDSQLRDCSVEPGDMVTANQAIAQLDERELKMELEEIEAEFHRASKKHDGFVASHESGEARLAQLEADGLRARKELLAYRAENLVLRSPIEGIVIAGDHKKAEGMPLKTGQSLFEIAPLDELYVELLVPEDDVRYVKEGMNVRIGLEAFPFESWSGTIHRVHPAAEIRDDENVFVATVMMENPTGRLRPGMRGSAKVSTVWRPISWNWLHKPVAGCLRWLGW